MLIGYDYNFYFYSIFASIFILIFIIIFCCLYCLAFDNDFSDVLNFNLYLDECITSILFSIMLTLLCTLLFFCIVMELDNHKIVNYTFEESYPLKIESVKREDNYLVINNELRCSSLSDINITDESSSYTVYEGNTSFGFNYGEIELTLNRDDIDLLMSLQSLMP